MQKKQVAILVDGGFFIKRYKAIVSRTHSPQQVANVLIGNLNNYHIDSETEELYRILYYDCPPLQKKAHNPITGQAVDFSKTETARFQNQLHKELRKKRKVALRLGHLNDDKGWILKDGILQSLVAKSKSIDNLQESDVIYSVRQKSVDMKIGIDIASLALKRMVQKIILIAGDSDFVPAAKLARREGIDFVLDPMWNHVAPDLHEHIDGLNSAFTKPSKPTR